MAKSKRKIVVLGGALSGPTAAARARETDLDAKIVVLERATTVSYAVGGLPYYLSREVDTRADLAPMRAKFFRRNYDVDVRTGVSVTRFDADKRRVYTDSGVFPYDSLIYALGAGSILPPVFGDGASNLSFLRNPSHLARIDSMLAKGAKRVAIVGGGYYGVEAADCLARRGLNVTLLERGPQLLPEFSPQAAGRAAAALAKEGVRVQLDSPVDTVHRKGRRIVALGIGAARLDCDMVLITAGVQPRTEIFSAAGGRTLRDASIRVDERCATNLDGVFATSICVSHPHAVTRKPVWTAQASDADKTAQVAGENAAGGDARLGPTLGTSILRAGDLHVARTGLTELGGRDDVARVIVGGRSCDSFFHGSRELDVSLYHAPKSMRVVGAEVIGFGGVDKRIDVLATAILGKLKLAQLAQLDLAYSPPYSTARDIINAAAVVAQHSSQVRAWDPADFASRKETALVFDLREPAGRKAAPLVATTVSLSQIADHRRVLQRTRQVVFVCETGRSSYLAARRAKQMGCADAGYVSGGLR